VTDSITIGSAISAERMCEMWSWRRPSMFVPSALSGNRLWNWWTRCDLTIHRNGARRYAIAAFATSATHLTPGGVSGTAVQLLFRASNRSTRSLRNNASQSAPWMLMRDRRSNKRAAG